MARLPAVAYVRVSAAAGRLGMNRREGSLLLPRRGTIPGTGPTGLPSAPCRRRSRRITNCLGGGVGSGPCARLPDCPVDGCDIPECSVEL